MKLFRSSLLLVFISSTCEGVTSIEPRVEIGLVDVPEPITCVFLPDPVLIYKPEDLIDSMYTEISVFDFEGVLAVQFMIDEAGKVQSPEIVRGFKPINKRLLEIASHFVFEPAQQNGIPVPVSYLYPFRITFDKQFAYLEIYLLFVQILMNLKECFFPRVHIPIFCNT